MTTEPTATYEVSLDRDACDGIFACLVRDDRFVEATDGLAAIDAGQDVVGEHASGTVTATFDDDRIDEAQAAAAACPVAAIEVSELAGDDPEGTRA